jgi:hypothetical protein
LTALGRAEQQRARVLGRARALVARVEEEVGGAGLGARDANTVGLQMILLTIISLYRRITLPSRRPKIFFQSIRAGQKYIFPIRSFDVLGVLGTFCLF